jgi:predicted nucleic acid-binding protein
VKVLADSCAWSLLFRRKSRAALSGDEQFVLASLKEAIRDSRVGIVGAIRQEVLSGIKEFAQFEKLRTALQAFPDEPLTTLHFEEAARLFNLCRSCGIECGSTDILICAVAVQMQYDILTYDKGLKRCIQLLRTLAILP